MTKLIRFWFIFESKSGLAPAFKLGCSVTAYNFDDALELLHQKGIQHNGKVVLKDYIENIDITSLDPNHILPNILPPNFRGIWYPLGYN